MSFHCFGIILAGAYADVAGRVVAVVAAVPAGVSD